jgi:hypothetical protein
MSAEATDYLWERLPLPRLPGNIESRDPAATIGSDAPDGYSLHSWHISSCELVVCWQSRYYAATELLSDFREPLHVKVVE